MLKSDKILTVIKYILMAFIGFGMLYMAFEGKDMAQMYNDLKRANYTWVALALCCALMALISRAMRWNILLEPTGHQSSVINTFYAVAIGYFANIAFPRLGEVSRCTVLNRVEKIPFEIAIGTVISERLIDFLSLCVLTIIVFLLQFGLMKSFFDVYILPLIHIPSQSIIILLIVAAGFLFFLFYRLYRSQTFHSYVEKRMEGSKLFHKVWQFSKGVWDGLKSVLSLKRKLAFFLHTLFIWTMYFLMTYLCVFSIPATSHLTPIDGLFLLIAGSVGMMMPVQGGIGAFHFFISNSIALYGIEKQDGLVYATILHTSQMLFTIFLGSFSLLLLFLTSKKKVMA